MSPPRRVLCLNISDRLSGEEELRRLADWALRFSPLVEPVAPGALLLDLTGSRRLFGGERSASARVPFRSGAASNAPLSRTTSSSSLSNDAGPRTADELQIDFRIAQQAITALHEQGLTARAVMADTPGAALALATAPDFSDDSFQREGGSRPRVSDSVARDSSVRPGPTLQISASSRALPRAAQSPHVSLPSQTLPSEEPGWADCFAADFADQILIVPEGQASAYLAPLPPAALRLDPFVVDRLDAVGVRTIGDLLMLPRSSLPARFGPQLGRRIAQALGEIFESLTPLRPEPPPDAGQGFDGPVADAQTIESAAADLLNEVLARVIRNGRAIRRLDCVLYSEYAPPLVLPIWLSRGSRNMRHMLDLLRPRLEAALARGAAAAAVAMRRQRHHLEILPDSEAIAGFVGLRLIAVETSIWHAGQAELFDPCNAGDVEHLSSLVDRLVNRLGADAVVRAERLDDYQPERAYRYVPASEHGLEAAGSSNSPAVVAVGALSTVAGESAGPAISVVARETAIHTPLQPRPLRLLERPQAIRVTAVVPDGPPAWFYHAGREYAVAQAWGPERIETGWWRGPDVRRDYFRVQADSGEQFWVFHNPIDDGWYLHGVFA